MKQTTVTLIAVSTISGLLGGCSTQTKLANLFSGTHSNIAMSINGHFTPRMLDIASLRIIDPCLKPEPTGKSTHDDRSNPDCTPDRYDPSGKLLLSGNFEIRLGKPIAKTSPMRKASESECTYCFSGALGSQQYVFCQPPVELGLPKHDCPK